MVHYVLNKTLNQMMDAKKSDESHSLSCYVVILLKQNQETSPPTFGFTMKSKTSDSEVKQEEISE